jgi:hypothetical protein
MKERIAFSAGIPFTQIQHVTRRSIPEWYR